MKKNNKGFSLVELIIVIAIMAILAGAIAPALIRYIDKSRKSNDVTACKTINTAIDTALGNEKVYELLTTNGAVIEIKPKATVTEVTPVAETPGTANMSTAASSANTDIVVTAPTSAAWDSGFDPANAKDVLFNELVKSFSGKTPKINFKKNALSKNSSTKPDLYIAYVSKTGKISIFIGSSSDSTHNAAWLLTATAAGSDTTNGDTKQEIGSASECLFSILPETCDSYQ